MTLQNNISIKWVPTTSSLFYLNKDEWIDMIKIFIIKMNDNTITLLLKTRLEYFLSNGYNITISNVESDRSIIYPKFKCLNQRSVLIVIPNVPYFISTELIDNKIINYEPKKIKINVDKF